jgi:hypothetical protein
MAYSLSDTSWGWQPISAPTDPDLYNRWVAPWGELGAPGVYQTLGIDVPMSSATSDAGPQYDVSGLPQIYLGSDPSKPGNVTWAAFDQGGNLVGTPHGYQDDGGGWGGKLIQAGALALLAYGLGPYAAQAFGEGGAAGLGGEGLGGSVGTLGASDLPAVGSLGASDIGSLSDLSGLVGGGSTAGGLGGGYSLGGTLGLSDLPSVGSLGGSDLAGLNSLNGLTSLGGGLSSVPSVFNPAQDSASVGGSAYSGSVPGSVNLGSAGGSMSTGGSLWDSVSGLLGGNKGLLQLGGNLLSGYLQADAARSAGNQALDASREGNALLKYMYDTTRSDNMPALQARNNALAGYQGLLKNPGSITSDPGYQFGLTQGDRSIGSQAAAHGNYYSGATLKALDRFGQDYAGSKFDQSLNRYGNLAGLGQVGASTIGQAGMNYGNQASNNMLSAGSLRGATTLAGANSWGNALNSFLGYQDYLNRTTPGG